MKSTTKMTRYILATLLCLLILTTSAFVQGDTWETKAPMPAARTAVGGVIDGKLLVATGSPDGTALEQYDPSTNTWSTKAPIPTPRWFAGSGVIGNKLYVVGGCTSNADCRIGTTGALEAYDSVSNTWSILTPMPTPRSNAATGVIDGKLYVAGGIGPCPPCDQYATLEVYDPAANSWTTNRYLDQIELAQRGKEKLAALASAKPREVMINKSGPSDDGLYLAEFSLPPGFTFSRPAIDIAGRRLYVFTQRLSALGKDAESKRAARRGLRQVHEPCTLIVLDLDSLSVVKTLALPVFVGAAAFNPTNKKLYAAAKADGVTIIDTNTLSQQRVPLPGFPNRLAINPRTNRIYVLSEGFAGHDKMFVIDAENNTVIAAVSLDGSAGLVIVNPETNRVYASTVDPTKTRVFDGADNSPLEDLPSLWVVAAEPESGRLYALNMGPTGIGSAALALDAGNHAQLATILTSERLGSKGLAVNRGLSQIYIVLPAENQFAVIDSIAGVETNRFPINSPGAINLDPLTGRVLLSHAVGALGGWVLSVLDPKSLSAEAPEEFFDDFESEILDPAWTVVKARGSYSLAENRGSLRYHVVARSPGSGDAVTMLTRTFRGDRWMLEVKGSYTMGATGGARSLSLSISFGTRLRDLPTATINVHRYRGDWSGCCPGVTQTELSQKYIPSPVKESPPNQADSYVWRIVHNGRTVTVERSDDGINFVTEATNVFGPQIDKVIQYLCISGNSHDNGDAYGDFHYVRLAKTPH